MPSTISSLPEPVRTSNWSILLKLTRRLPPSPIWPLTPSRRCQGDPEGAAGHDDGVRRGAVVDDQQVVAELAVDMVLPLTRCARRRPIRSRTCRSNWRSWSMIVSLALPVTPPRKYSNWCSCRSVPKSCWSADSRRSTWREAEAGGTPSTPLPPSTVSCRRRPLEAVVATAQAGRCPAGPRRGRRCRSRW